MTQQNQLRELRAAVRACCACLAEIDLALGDMVSAATDPRLTQAERAAEAVEQSVELERDRREDESR